MLFFFPRGVLDEILNLTESVSEGFPTYFYMLKCNIPYLFMLLPSDIYRQTDNVKNVRITESDIFYYM